MLEQDSELFILCAPLRTVSGEKMASLILNKIDGEFEQEDLDLLEAMTEQAAIAIQGNIVEQIEVARKQELEFLDVVSQVSSELELTSTSKNHHHYINYVGL